MLTATGVSKHNPFALLPWLPLPAWSQQLNPFILGTQYGVDVGSTYMYMYCIVIVSNTRPKYNMFMTITDSISYYLSGPRSTAQNLRWGYRCLGSGGARGKRSPSDCECDVRCSCLLYTSPSPRDRTRARMPSSA